MGLYGDHAIGRSLIFPIETLSEGSDYSESSARSNQSSHVMRVQALLSLWSVTSIDKIPEVAKTKVSKPKRYLLSKLRLDHALLIRLI